MDALSDRFCYSAMCSRDSRFDGLFFVGVTTTSIYCRPICPARTPALSHCRFFATQIDAEKAGFRPCFRCRPELAPGSKGASVDARPSLVAAAERQIASGYLAERSLADLADSLGVSDRHLRRAMVSELGVTPVELAQSRRLALAKQLLQDTSLSLSEIAFASGFGSIRRFNALFRARFAQAPSALRRRAEASSGQSLTLRLDYRPPLDFGAMLSFLATRATSGVEVVDLTQGVYLRSVQIDSAQGVVQVRQDQHRQRLYVQVSLGLLSKLLPLITQLRALFDLDAHPERIQEHLSRDPLLCPLLEKHRGLRIPGSLCGYELALRAIVGQQVSVAAASTLSGRIAARYGDRLVDGARDGISLLAPRAAVLARADLDELASLGLTKMRAQAIVALSQAVAEGRLPLPGIGKAVCLDPEATLHNLIALPGIGPWTAAYIAMRALRYPDALPASDLVLKKALGARGAGEVEKRAKDWQPFRSYAVMHLWAAC